MTTATQPEQTSTMNGAEVLVESLVRHGGETIFAYPGGASMPIHQALTKYRDQIRTILPRHEQGVGFGAIGYARSTGRVGLAMVTSGPGATNVVTCLADAKMDSIPLVVVTGQVGSKMIGTDAFQETPITDIAKLITKHHYLVTDVNDIVRIVKEAFHIAATGRPGPVLIDIPKDIQLAPCAPDWDASMALRGYRAEVKEAAGDQIDRVAQAIALAKKPLLYIGGGVISANAAPELRKFVKKTGIPAVETLTGLGALDGRDPLCLGMPGMHGSVYANYAISDADLLLSFGVRFDDRVTGKLEEFCKHGVIVHVDIDPGELNKNKPAHMAIEADVKPFIASLNEKVSACEIAPWVAKLKRWREESPLAYHFERDEIRPQYVIETLSKMVEGKGAFLSTGVGQHQMWSAQFYDVIEPRSFFSSAGLGTMGYGLPTALGVQAANPGRLSIAIEGDGSLQMNIQELGTLVCEKLPVKIVILNNQHLGMVMQWEDRFHEGNRAHTYLGPIDDPKYTGSGDGWNEGETYPDFVTIAAGYGIAAKRVRKRADVPAALEEMLAHDGPYLLDVISPYQEHVLPMIPAGKSVTDIIKA